MRLPLLSLALIASALLSTLVGQPQNGQSIGCEHAGHRFAAHSVPSLRVASQPVSPSAAAPTALAFGNSRASSTFAVGAAVHDLDPWLYFEWVDGLVSFPTRYTNSATFPQVTAYLKAEFENLGFQTWLDPYSINGNTRNNVVAEIPGSIHPNHVVIVCGHFDSISQDSQNNAPGADDNASGTAGVLELARVLRNYDFDATIRFVCFSGEEQGLVGSKAYVDGLVAAGTLNQVKAVINMDMIGYMNNAKMDVLIEGHANHSKTLMDLLVSMAAEHTDLKTFRSTRPFGSDHMPFINRGINAVLTIEEGYYANPHYHKTSDRISTLSIPLALEILKMNIAATATAAGILDSGTSGTVTAYGQSLGGSNIGSLASTSTPNLGATFDIDVSGFSNSSSLTLMISADQDGVPGYGGTVLIDLTQLIHQLNFPISNGSATVSIPIPTDPSFVGRSAYFQAGGVDPTQPEGVALSHGLKIRVGE